METSKTFITLLSIKLLKFKMANKKLLDKLIKNSTIKDISLLNESEIFKEQDKIPTPIPLLNVFLSGSFDSGIEGYHYALGGQSGSLKSVISLILMKSYFNKYDDAVAIIYDSEKGISKSYIKSLDIPEEKVIRIPFQTLEELRNDLIPKLEAIEKGEHVFILIDSVSNAGSLKELQDTLDDKTTQDLTRSRTIKSIFRLATGYVVNKNIPLVSINHLYSNMDQYNPYTMASGSGVKYSAQVIWEITKLKGKDKDDPSNDFRIKVTKSRFIKENSSFLLSVPHSGIMKKFSGLFDLAIEYGFISQSGAWYEVPCLNDYQDRKVRKKEIENSSEFWNKIFSETNFKEVVESSIKVSQDQSSLFNDIEEEYQDAINNSKEVFEDDETE